MRKSTGFLLSVLSFASMLALAATMLALAASVAHAQRWHREFYGRDFHHFGPHEVRIWRGGHWVHDWHFNRFGWWWVVGGVWYFYPQPIYPYPTYEQCVYARGNQVPGYAAAPREPYIPPPPSLPPPR